ncbi:hypothetical protein O3P69_003603 [Scylla paramamosain]|uniref:Uncharacterized protein n=1 Tax=Scylla paramamosain TaxID=85552 RepID=A0AAW0UHZ5_SCYPA
MHWGGIAAPRSKWCVVTAARAVLVAAWRAEDQHSSIGIEKQRKAGGGGCRDWLGHGLAGDTGTGRGTQAYTWACDFNASYGSLIISVQGNILPPRAVRGSGAADASTKCNQQQRPFHLHLKYWTRERVSGNTAADMAESFIGVFSLAETPLLCEECFCWARRGKARQARQRECFLMIIRIMENLLAAQSQGHPLELPRVLAVEGLPFVTGLVERHEGSQSLIFKASGRRVKGKEGRKVTKETRLGLRELNSCIESNLEAGRRKPTGKGRHKTIAATSDPQHVPQFTLESVPLPEFSNHPQCLQECVCPCVSLCYLQGCAGGDSGARIRILHSEKEQQEQSD